MNFLDWIREPWPWYVAGPVIGLTVPALLVLGNKSFGISSSLRHACAACLPGKVPFFQYDWKKEIWNLVFVLGILFGGFIASHYLFNGQPIEVSPALKAELATYGVTDYSGMVPKDLISWEALFSVRGVVMMVLGGFFVGFGTRYAGGCTSGHSIMGLSNLQWPSLVATMAFMIGGILFANLVLPYILAL